MNDRHWQWNKLRLVALAPAILVMPVAHAEAEGAPDAVPANFVHAWQEAVSGVGVSQKEAMESLAANSSWEPYFRSAFNGLSEQKTRDRLRVALSKCQTRLLDWNLGRANGWAKD